MTENWNLIVGNGFNEALEKCGSGVTNLNLTHEKISNEMKVLIKNKSVFEKECVINLIEKCSNSEKLLRVIFYYQKYLEFGNEIYYDKRFENLENILKDHYKVLRESFVDVITSEDFHPTLEQIKGVDLTICSNNLSIFKRIFTINYDLILYWIVLIKKMTYKFKDGFCMEEKITDNSNREYRLLKIKLTNPFINLYFIHGALHLVQAENGIFKISKSKDEPSTLIEIRCYLLKELEKFEALIITEPTSEKKENEVVHNPYLTLCYEKILSCKNNIIIYGCSIFNDEMNDLNNDKYLWEQVMRSDAKNVYIGIYKNDIYNNDEIKKTLRDLSIRCNSREKNILFFKSSEINIFSNDNFIESVRADSIRI